MNRQLSALRTDDFDSAYQYAATGVQQKFSRTQFELMIRRDFSSMTEAHRVEFGAVQVAGAAALVQVFLTTPDGASARLSLQFYGGGGRLENRRRPAPGPATAAPACAGSTFERLTSRKGNAEQTRIRVGRAQFASRRARRDEKEVPRARLHFAACHRPFQANEDRKSRLLRGNASSA